MDRFLTRGQLHGLLRECGHTFSSVGRDEAPIDVCPPSELYLTVGLDPDGALKSAYRARYFACVRNPDDEPRLLHAPAFALQGHFATAAEREPGNNDFVDGPVRWLLARIRRFGGVLLWPKHGFCGSDGLDFLARVVGGERIHRAPHLARWFTHHVPEAAQVGAIRLNLSDVDDCQVLWEVANLVGVQGYDFFLSDSAAREVYCLHHHDKLVISIPDARARQELLEELASQSELLEDCSGYWFETDEEIE